MALNANDVDSWIDCIRQALDVANDWLSEEEWDEVNTAWAWITDTLKEDVQPIEEDEDPEVCSFCGSDNLMWDAYVDAKGEVIATFGNVECGDCGDQTRAIPLSEFEAKDKEDE